MAFHLIARPPPFKHHPPLEISTWFAELRLFGVASVHLGAASHRLSLVVIRGRSRK